MNISYIKEEMIDYIDSPVPYLIGVSDELWTNKISMTKWNETQDDVVAFHLESALMMQKIDIPSGPEPMTSILIHTIEDLLNRE